MNKFTMFDQNYVTIILLLTIKKSDVNNKEDSNDLLNIYNSFNSEYCQMWLNKYESVESSFFRVCFIQC